MRIWLASFIVFTGLGKFARAEIPPIGPCYPSPIRRITWPPNVAAPPPAPPPVERPARETPEVGDSFEREGHGSAFDPIEGRDLFATLRGRSQRMNVFDSNGHVYSGFITRVQSTISGEQIVYLNVGGNREVRVRRRSLAPQANVGFPESLSPEQRNVLSEVSRILQTKGDSTSGAMPARELLGVLLMPNGELALASRALGDPTQLGELSQLPQTPAALRELFRQATLPDAVELTPKNELNKLTLSNGEKVTGAIESFLEEDGRVTELEVRTTAGQVRRVPVETVTVSLPIESSHASAPEVFAAPTSPEASPSPMPPSIFGRPYVAPGDVFVKPYSRRAPTPRPNPPLKTLPPLVPRLPHAHEPDPNETKIAAMGTEHVGPSEQARRARAPHPGEPSEAESLAAAQAPVPSGFDPDGNPFQDANLRRPYPKQKNSKKKTEFSNETPEETREILELSLAHKIPVEIRRPPLIEVGLRVPLITGIVRTLGPDEDGTEIARIETHPGRPTTPVAVPSIQPRSIRLLREP